MAAERGSCGSLLQKRPAVLFKRDLLYSSKETCCTLLQKQKSRLIKRAHEINTSDVSGEGPYKNSRTLLQKSPTYKT